MFNKHWFRRFYAKEFITVVNYYAATLSKKVIPSFDNISEEAKQIEQETWDRLGKYFDPERDDPSFGCETAFHAGVDFYIMATNIKQGIVNMYAAGLYHLFEQQLLKLHRQEFLSMEERERERESARSQSESVHRQDRTVEPNKLKPEALFAGIY